MGVGVVYEMIVELLYEATLALIKSLSVVRHSILVRRVDSRKDFRNVGESVLLGDSNPHFKV